MKVLLLVSAFNGLSQRVLTVLDAAGHQVSVQLAVDEPSMIRAARLSGPDLILCPFLRDRVPAAVWSRWPTIVIHPGPVGDRGPSSLDWAITDAIPVWGVTALQAVEEMDAGPIWAHREFPMPSEPARKSSLYGGPVADAAVACVEEVMVKAADPAFTPTPLARAHRPVPGTGVRPMMRQQNRAFSWEEPAAAVLRRIRAADGSPGVRARLGGSAAHLFDAHVPAGKPVRLPAARPGTIVGHDGDRVAVATGNGYLWIGQVKMVDGNNPTGIGGLGRLGVKQPAALALQHALAGVPLRRGPDRIRYRRHGDVGELVFDVHNGAMSPYWSRRLAAALRRACAADTSVLVVRGGVDAFCNGIDLNAIEMAPDPQAAAWASIRAINAVCRAIAAMSPQVIVAGVSGNAGAGGVMLPLGAEVVAARDGIVLNPFYDIGLYGSELHTQVLPARVGPVAARRLLSQRLPIDAAAACRLGLVDVVGPRDPEEYAAWLLEMAREYVGGERRRQARARKAAALSGPPLTYWEAKELAEMAMDIFDDRNQFAERRAAFVYKQRPQVTPRHLANHPQAA
ncbi:enoyl-CoA hydratase-related protein [Dactylosporangium sp. CA-152071]|uniref:enoyl-CoA hydratase-related protein n=1 Tax=Dactylosporangium sp. CA-152071 TaxID=3239933 RepID=UPI003D8F2664